MGLFDTYGQTQLKVGDVSMADYKIGDVVQIPDGLYLGWDGFVVIQGRRFVAEFDSIIDTHGHQFTADDALRLLRQIS